MTLKQLAIQQRYLVNYLDELLQGKIQLKDLDKDKLLAHIKETQAVARKVNL